MAIPPINAAAGGFNVTGPEWQVGGVSDVAAPAAGQGGGSFGGMLAQQLNGLQSVQDDAAKASQALATGQASDVSFAVQTDAGSALRADGNGVDMDTESANLAENGLEYQALVQVARGRLDILDSAIGH